MLTIIVFVIEICIEWNKRIFSFKNQCASGWQINIIRWCQRDRVSLGSSKDCKGLGGSIQRRWMTSHMPYFTYVCQNFSLKKKQDTIRTVGSSLGAGRTWRTIVRKLLKDESNFQMNKSKTIFHGLYSCSDHSNDVKMSNLRTRHWDKNKLCHHHVISMSVKQ